MQRATDAHDVDEVTQIIMEAVRRTLRANDGATRRRSISHQKGRRAIMAVFLLIWLKRKLEERFVASKRARNESNDLNV
jgi:hypothetical protein